MVFRFHTPVAWSRFRSIRQQPLEPRIVLAAPVAVADQYLVEGSSLVVPADGVLANDSDPDTDPLSAMLVDQPANGAVTLNSDGSFVYTPAPGFRGLDSFTYRAVTPFPTQTYLIDQVASNLRIDATLTVPLFGTRTSNDTSSLIGDLAVRVSPDQTPFGEIHVTGLDVTLADGIELIFDYGFFTGRISAEAPPVSNTDPTLAPFRLQMLTPGSPAAVIGGNFNQAANTMKFDGIADVTATGFFANLVESGPQSLAIDDLMLDLAGTVTLAGSTVSVSLPIAFSDTFEFDGGSIDVVASGTVVAHAPVAVPEESNLVTVSLDVQSSPGQIGRYLFYNDSAFDAANDSDAIDFSIEPLIPGETATGANFSNYASGINGVIIDLPAAGSPLQITPADFEFRQGITSEVTQWAAAASPVNVTVTPAGGDDGTDRVAITWNDNSIADTWLEVTVLANSRTGLFTPDVFYFGNLRGDATRDGHVDATDFSVVRSNPANFRNRADVGTPVDLNQDSLVDASDLLLVRDHATGAGSGLPMISPGGVAVVGKHEFDDSLPSDSHRPASRSVLKSIATGVGAFESMIDRERIVSRRTALLMLYATEDPESGADRAKLRRLDTLFAELSLGTPLAQP